jgi:GTPase SAR1 family protein
MEETRTPKQIIIIGTNGTGKTTALKKLVAKELQKKDSHVLIVVPDDMEWNMIPFVHPKFPHRIESYVGARKIIYFPGLLEIISERFRDGMLIFDDCRAYLSASVEQDLHDILIRRRQKMIDVCAVGHGFTEVPPKFFTFCTHIVLFRTTDSINKRKDDLKDFERMKEAQARVNQKALTDPHYNEVIKF